jgi:TM2 domain-containing membrane protein YozV
MSDFESPNSFPNVPPPQGYSNNYAPGYEDPHQRDWLQPELKQPKKSKVAAGLFGIFLGAFGVHNFYLGFFMKGFIQLFLTVFTIGLLSWVSAIWGIIEGVLIITSHEGSKWHRDAENAELID